MALGASERGSGVACHASAQPAELIPLLIAGTQK